MRIGTQICKGDGLDGFVDLLTKYYPAGKLAVVAQDEETGRQLIKKMGAEYNTLLYKDSNVQQLAENVRFVVGIGDIGVIAPVKKIAENRKYAFYPTAYDYRFLHNFDGIRTLPEFVYVDKNELEREDLHFIARTYCMLFQLYSEALFQCCYESIFPYKNKGLKGICDAAREVLMGNAEKTQYYDECFRLTVNIINALYSLNIKSLVSEKTARNYGYTVAEQFSVTYFIDILLINFTKRRFRDILLPSGKPIADVIDVSSEAFDATQLPTPEELRFFARKMKFLTELQPLDTTLLLRALNEAVDESNPLFAIIKNKGILEGLYDERFKNG